MQVVEPPMDAHCDMQTPLQLPSQSPSHEPWQLKFPGLAEQLPMQLAEQEPVHDTVGGVAWQLPMQLASSWPEHATWKLTGVHRPVHWAETSSSQFSVPLPAKIAAPLQAVARSAQFVPARALPVNRTPTAASATATSEDQRTM
jgi:hypothetical protein